MTEVIETRINWRKTLLGIKKGRSFEKKDASAKEINAAKNMATRIKKEGLAEFTIALLEDRVTIKRIA